MTGTSLTVFVALLLASIVVFSFLLLAAALMMRKRWDGLAQTSQTLGSAASRAPQRDSTRETPR